MGIRRRLLGGDRAQGVHLNTNIFTRMRDDAALAVVGEAYRQGNVASARPPAPGDLPPGLPPPPAGYYKAMLIREPRNQYDPNAIAVFLWAGGTWVISGYLARPVAALYQPLFRYLSLHSEDVTPAIAADAARVREGSGYGVILHLGTPAECAAELATDDAGPTDHPWVGKAIVFTGQSATTLCGVPVDRYAQVMLARWAGCELLPRLTKKTDALIVADPLELTSNLQKAKEYGIPIVQEADFFVRIGVASSLVGRATERWARS